jgi:hypothetical protein
MISTSPTPVKHSPPIVISQDIKDATNEKLVAMISHKAYDFCINQDMSSETLEVASDKLEQLILAGLNRIFLFNGQGVISQFHIYEAIEDSFNSQAQYDIIKCISALRRIKLWDGVDADDSKYIRWMTNRVKFATQSICNKLDYITNQERLH